MGQVPPWLYSQMADKWAQQNPEKTIPDDLELNKKIEMYYSITFKAKKVEIQRQGFRPGSARKPGSTAEPAAAK